MCKIHVQIRSQLCRQKMMLVPSNSPRLQEDSLRLCLVDNKWRSADEAEAMSADDLRSFAIVELSKHGRCTVTDEREKPRCHELDNAQLARTCEQPEEEEDGFAEDSLRLCLVVSRRVKSVWQRQISGIQH